jgi:signal transduction histidine kinase
VHLWSIPPSFSAQKMAESSVARVDCAGRLLAADPRLLGLQQRAGASLGDLLAVPPLASMARLARTLGILVSRSVVVAEGDHDLDVWVRARPDGESVVLSVGGWAIRPQRAPWLIPQGDGDLALPVTSEDWTWTTDAVLRLTGLSFGDQSQIGQPLTRVVRFLENENGDLPVIDAVAGAHDLIDQRAIRRDLPDSEIVLSAKARTDVDGRFIGFDGRATGYATPTINELPYELPVDNAFAERLDKALRAPLGRIVANADSIRAQSDGPLRRDYADYAGDIASAARHLLALVDDLGDLQAVERADFRPEIEDIDLADIARRAAGLLQVRAGDRNVRIDRPASDDRLAARGEFRRVLQIVVNLIGNAVRYSPEGSMVWLRTERDADTAVLIVADQGKGIAIDDQARIFEKFERVDASEPGGSGLGLYISRRLARAMGGDIVVDSAPGQGARFVLTLPAA